MSHRLFTSKELFNPNWMAVCWWFSAAQSTQWKRNQEWGRFYSSVGEEKEILEGAFSFNSPPFMVESVCIRLPIDVTAKKNVSIERKWISIESEIRSFDVLKSNFRNTIVSRFPKLLLLEWVTIYGTAQETNRVSLCLSDMDRKWIWILVVPLCFYLEIFLMKDN